MEDFTLLGAGNTPLDALEVSMRGLSARSKAISLNLANVSTHNYKRREVVFEDALKDKLNGVNAASFSGIDKTHSSHIGPDKSKVSNMDPQMSINPGDILTNGNNVDIDREMLDLSKTGLRYKAITRLSRRYIDGMKGVIRGS